MSQIQLDFSDCLDELIDMVDYLLALRGGEAECNTMDDIPPLTENEMSEYGGILSEIEYNLRFAIDSLIRNLLLVNGIMRYDDDCDYESLQEIYELILEKGKRGYSELLEICNANHPDFGKFKAEVKTLCNKCEQ